MKPSIYLISGPCGCGKSTLADAYAKYLVDNGMKQQVYVIHGDDFHAGFYTAQKDRMLFASGQAAKPLAWQQILMFNWECILSTAQKALERKVDVLIDYVVEEELPLVRRLARQCDARLFYVVLTASQEILAQRLAARGDADLTERALFLKQKLEKMPENQNHLLDNADRSVSQVIELLEAGDYRCAI